MNPVEYAKRGDLGYFQTVELDVLLNCRGETGNSLLGITALYNQLSCCEVIYKRCPSLLYSSGNAKGTALHTAAVNGHEDVVQFLISVSAEAEQDIESPGRDKLLFMVTSEGKTALHLAVDKKFLVTAKLLVEADTSKKLLQMVDRQKDSCMHYAVKNQDLDMVKMLSDAAPDLDYAANVSGQTPLLMAFQLARTDNLNSGSIRTLLLETKPNTCKFRTGDKEWTLLHLAASKGDLATIEDIIRVCPDCLKLVDQNGQNILHIAIKFDRANVVKHIMGMRNISVGILNQQDNNGNTPLHYVVLSENMAMVLLLLYDSRVNKTILNEQQLKAIDMITFDYDKRKAGVYGLTDRINEKEIKEASDFDLLVCALIATVSFTAGITVPGGYFSDGENKGTAILSAKISFKLFVLSNTIALVLSLSAVFSHFCARHFRNKKDIIFQINVATLCSLFAIFAMIGAFITGSYAVLATIDEYAITVTVLCCCFFIFAFHAMWRMVMQQKLPAP